MPQNFEAFPSLEEGRYLGFAVFSLGSRHLESSSVQGWSWRALLPFQGVLVSPAAAPQGEFGAPQALGSLGWVVARSVSLFAVLIGS